MVSQALLYCPINRAAVPPVHAISTLTSARRPRPSPFGFLGTSRALFWGNMRSERPLVTSQQAVQLLGRRKRESGVSPGMRYCRRDAPYMVWEVITAYTSTDGKPCEQALCGNIDAAERLDFTAIGPAVNLVSRLEAVAKSLIEVRDHFAGACGKPLTSLGYHQLGGLASPHEFFLPQHRPLTTARVPPASRRRAGARQRARLHRSLRKCRDSGVRLSSSAAFRRRP